MKASDIIKESIKKHEGIKLKAYRCPANVWTIGYGHTKDVNEGMSITQSEADDFLEEDVTEAEEAVISLIGKSLMPFVLQQEFDSMVSFVFNLGKPKTRKYSILKKWRKRFNARKVLYYSDEEILYWFGKYVYGDGKRLPGLVKRRKEEAENFIKQTN